MTRARILLLSLLGAAAGAAGACRSSGLVDMDLGPQGAEGQVCRPGGLCDSPLACVGNICTRGPAPPVADGAPAADGGPQPDAAAVFSAWAKAFPGRDTNLILDLDVDAQGRAFFGGVIRGEIDFGSGPLTPAPGDSSAAFVGSTDAGGDIRWATAWAVDGEASSVTVDAEGHLLATGTYSGTLKVGAEQRASKGLSDGYLVRANPSGAELWVATFGGASGDFARDVAVDSQGNVFVAGYFTGEADLGGGQAASKGASDAFLTSYTKEGAHRWAKTFGGAQNEQAHAVAVDDQGNIVLVGSFGSTMSFGGPERAPVDSTDAFIVGLTANGAHRWTRTRGGQGADSAEDVAVDRSGNVFVVGRFSNSISDGQTTWTSKGGRDAFLISFAKDGADRWTRTFGGSDSVEGRNLDVDEQGNVYLIAAFSGAISLGGKEIAAGGTANSAIASHDNAGTFRWMRALLGPSSVQADGMAAGAKGVLIVSGNFKVEVDVGTEKLTGSADYAPFILRMASSGP